MAFKVVSVVVEVRLTVPAYPPEEVSVIVEFPLAPGEADGIVMLATVIVKLGLFTEIDVFPEDCAYAELPL